jgi:hypothetical protein
MQVDAPWMGNPLRMSRVLSVNAFEGGVPRVCLDGGLVRSWLTESQSGGWRTQMGCNERCNNAH